MTRGAISSMDPLWLWAAVMAAAAAAAVAVGVAAGATVAAEVGEARAAVAVVVVVVGAAGAAADRPVLIGWRNVRWLLHACPNNVARGDVSLNQESTHAGEGALLDTRIEAYRKTPRRARVFRRCVGKKRQPPRDVGRGRELREWGENAWEMRRWARHVHVGRGGQVCVLLRALGVSLCPCI